MGDINFCLIVYVNICWVHVVTCNLEVILVDAENTISFNEVCTYINVHYEH